MTDIDDRDARFQPTGTGKTRRQRQWAAAGKVKHVPAKTQKQQERAAKARAKLKAGDRRRD